MGTGFQMTQAIRRTALNDPDGIATIDGDRVRSHAEHLSRVERLAGALRAAGIRDGARISVLAVNSDRYLELYMATWWAGGVIAPLNVRWTVDEMAAALNDVGAEVLAIDDTFIGLLPALREKVAGLREIVYIGNADVPEGTTDYERSLEESTPVADAGRRSDDLAAILFTGGTTGAPKGVMISHDSVVAAGIGMRAMGCATSERLLQAAPLFHVGGLQMSSCHWWGSGTHVFVPGFQTTKVLTAIQEHRITDVLLAPTMISMLLNDPDVENFDLSSLKQIVYGTAPMTQALLAKAMRLAPSSSFAQGYGMTETCMTVMLPPYFHTPEGQKLGKLEMLGLTAPFAEMKVVDPEGNELPRGEVGELIVRGPSVMSGYWGKPAETAAALRDGWMHSGDGAIIDADGFVCLVDRIKDMIVTGGENVYSMEVENAVASHPDVLQVAVIGVPHPIWIEAVHAVVVPRPGAEVTLEQLVEHCRPLISGYKVPRSLEVVEALPLSSAGKVLKVELRARAATPAVV